MKRFFIILLLSFSFSYAKDDSKSQYSQAFYFYNKKDFVQSYKLFSKIYLARLSDIKLNFSFGRSAYETGHYEMALASFERVEMLGGESVQNSLEMAKTYLMLKMYDDAENRFKALLANPTISQKLRKNIEELLSKITKVQQRSFTYAKVDGSLFFDSNVNYGSLGEYRYDGVIHSGVRERSDYGSELYANVINIYDVGERGSFSLKNNLFFYTKEYRRMNGYDIGYGGYTPSLVYKGIKYVVVMSVGADSMTLNHKSYLQTFFVAPRFEYSNTTTVKTFVTLKYQRKDFIQKREDSLDARRYELLYGMQKILSPHSYFQLNLDPIFERKMRSGDIYVDFNEYKFSLFYGNKFNSVWSCDGSLQLRERNYLQYSNGFGSKRMDNGGSINGSLMAKILPTLQVDFKGSYEYVASNQKRFSYQKYILSFGIVKTF